MLFLLTNWKWLTSAVASGLIVFFIQGFFHNIEVDQLKAVTDRALTAQATDLRQECADAASSTEDINDDRETDYNDLASSFDAVDSFLFDTDKGTPAVQSPATGGKQANAAGRYVRSNAAPARDFAIYGRDCKNFQIELKTCNRQLDNIYRMNGR